MKYLAVLEQNFQFASYKAGGNYRVGVDYNNIGYLINSDCSVMCVKHNNTYLTLTELKNLDDNEIELYDLDDSYVIEIVGDWDNQYPGEVISLNDKKLEKLLLEKFNLFHTLTK